MALLAALSPRAARADAIPPSGNAIEAIDRFVGQFVELGMFDGTILVDIGGEVVYERSFGYAHFELGVPHDSRTRFRIASVSKTVTDAAFAVMIQRGVLQLDTPIARYLPEFPSADEITIGHLLDHTSGIPHTNDQPWGDGRTSLSLDEIVTRLAALPLEFAPGSDSSYSNGGYAVAAKILEIAGGGTYGQVMKTVVFDPLGMSDTGHLADARAVIERIATGYEPGPCPGERRHARFYAAETRPGGGSLFSTARDLLAFVRGIFRDGFVSEALRESVLGAEGGRYLAQGRSPGFVAKIYYAADEDVIVVSLSNNYAVPADWARAIADLVTGVTDSQPWPAIERSTEVVEADDPRLGRYRNSRGGTELTIEMSHCGGMLLSDAERDSITGLVPLTDGSFLLPLYFQRCEQDEETRAITCRMLSGNERYSSVLTPVEG